MKLYLIKTEIPRAGLWIGLAVLLATTVGAGDPPKEPALTYYRDVLPILTRRCQNCHQAGGIAPMPLLSYEDVRPWAQAVRESVLLRRMPPWYADPKSSVAFSNDRSLSEAELATISDWVNQGSPAGEVKNVSAPPRISHDWRLGTPDVVYEMGEFPVPAKGTIEYTYYIIPSSFTEDKWVRAAEFKVGQPAVVHHMNAFIREPDNDRFVPGYPPRTYFVPKTTDNPTAGQSEHGLEANLAKQEVSEARRRGSPNGPVFGELLAPFEPGLILEPWEPGQARLIKAGSDIVIQCHFTANGTPVNAASSLGLTFAKEPPTERVITFVPANTKFVIPPGHPNYKVEASAVVLKEVKLLSMQPHMHLRGKSFYYRAVLPGGAVESLLSVPKYDFNWQLNYYLRQPRVLPPGTRLEFVAHYDNSPDNPANPNPAAEVRWGDQSWEEMMIGFLEVAFDPKYTSDSVIYRNEE